MDSGIDLDLIDKSFAEDLDAWVALRKAHSPWEVRA
jgi:hypothetical protein